MAVDWKGRVVIVTGASSGIGKALAEEFASQGAQVGLVARRESELRELAKSLDSSAAWYVADVTELAQIQAATSSIEDALGPCDVMIANAGIYRRDYVNDWNVQAATDVIRTNVIGAMNAISTVLPQMVARKQGQIVGISSIAGELGMPGSAAYCSSKAALSRLLESMRIDLAEYGIKVTTVCPGFVDTPLITDEERETRRDVVNVHKAARRILKAIDRQRAECWFPWSTAAQARLARHLPPWLFDWVMRKLEPMEEMPD